MAAHANGDGLAPVAEAGDEARAGRDAGRLTLAALARRAWRADPLLVLSTMFVAFMAGSAVGWAYEMLNDLVVRHGWYPRAWLAGPWCPIYGIGTLLVAATASVVAWGGARRKGDAAEDRPSTASRLLRLLATCAIIVLATTGTELVGSYVCEWLAGSFPWDYSPSWGDFEGRIAPEFAMRFLLMGLAYVYLIEPRLVSWCEAHAGATKAMASMLLALLAGDAAIEQAGVWARVVPREGMPLW